MNTRPINTRRRAFARTKQGRCWRCRSPKTQVFWQSAPCVYVCQPCVDRVKETRRASPLAHQQ